MDKPTESGYWVVWCKFAEMYEVVFVGSDLESFSTLGYDLESLIPNPGYQFIKPFEPENIILCKDI